jgi:hypothetical protein
MTLRDDGSFLEMPCGSPFSEPTNDKRLLLSAAFSELVTKDCFA